MTSIARQVNTMLVGAVLAQFVGLAASPMLTRLFTPGDFATLALFGGALGVLAVVAGGRYEMAVLLPKADADASHLLALSLSLAGITALVTCLIVWVGSDHFAARWSWPNASTWLWLLAPCTFLSCALSGLGNWVNRAAAYPVLAGSRVAQATTAAVLSVVLGWRGGHEIGLVWGTCAGLVVGCLWLLVGCVRMRRPRRLKLSWAAMGSLARRNAEFPCINLPHALLDSLQAALLLSLLGAGWGATALGLYALVLRVVRTPLAMVGSSMAQVFQQRAAQAFNAGQPLRPLVLMQWRQARAWLLFLALLAGSAPWWFGRLFGQAWSEGGVYALILLPWMAMNFLCSPLSQLPLVVGRQRGGLRWGVAYQAAMLLPVWLAQELQTGMRVALAMHALCAAAVLVGYAAWLLRISDSRSAAAGQAIHGRP